MEQPAMILETGKGGVRVVREDGVLSPFQAVEPEWIPDDQAKACARCNGKFSFLRRKHHCRRCGNVFCGDCVDARLPVLRLCYEDPVRVCENCKPQTNVENDFFTKHLKILVNGADFDVELQRVMHSGDGEGSADTSFPAIRVALSADQKTLTFGVGETIPAMLVKNIRIQERRSESSEPGSPTPAEGNGNLVLEAKSVGRVTISASQDQIKKWRRAIKGMIKTLHGSTSKKKSPEPPAK
eukprot:m.70682 g.70682  ORF g.70682 m.70682 type:complete len:240 (-) comp12153_c0_seq1:3065-3784(-)